MSSHRLESYRQQAVTTRSCPDVWERVRIRSAPETAPVLDAVTAAMAAEGYPESDVFGMRLALEEGIVNAIKHGHQDDPSLHVRVSYRVNFRRAVVEIEDQGPGFDPHQVADPCATENLDRPCGRGLLLMRHYATWLRYNERGNCVALCKYRSNR